MLIGIALLLFPAALANMAPVFFAKTPVLAIPLDGGRHFRGRRILGENKTVRGLVFGILAAIAASALETAFASSLAPYALIDYGTVNPILLGTLLGLGALIGDSLKSFFKRQLDIAPGEHFIPFDQLDWILGTFIALLPIATFSPVVYALAIILGGCLHPVANIVGYHLGLKRNMF